MVNSKNGLLSTLQNLIDHKLRNSNLFIILCGSSISFMENEVLSHKSPYRIESVKFRVYTLFLTVHLIGSTLYL